MPIYSYGCPACGHAQDHLMKMSDPAPACPSCGGRDYAKKVTAAAFALKGGGYYATDFKDPPKAGASGSSPSQAGEASAGGCGSSCACHPG